MIRVSIDSTPPDANERRVSWQLLMFAPGCAESVAVQQELFPGELPERRPAAPRPEDSTQGRLFEG
jgi:hypothetical protein